MCPDCVHTPMEYQVEKRTKRRRLDGGWELKGFNRIGLFGPASLMAFWHLWDGGLRRERVVLDRPLHRSAVSWGQKNVFHTSFRPSLCLSAIVLTHTAATQNYQRVVGYRGEIKVPLLIGVPIVVIIWAGTRLPLCARVKRQGCAHTFCDPFRAIASRGRVLSRPDWSASARSRILEKASWSPHSCLQRHIAESHAYHYYAPDQILIVCFYETKEKTHWGQHLDHKCDATVTYEHIILHIYWLWIFFENHHVFFRGRLTILLCPKSGLLRFFGGYFWTFFLHTETPCLISYCNAFQITLLATLSQSDSESQPSSSTRVIEIPQRASIFLLPDRYDFFITVVNIKMLGSR